MEGKFNVILVDSPWDFKVWNRDTGHGRSAESHYSTMTLDDIGALPVLDAAHENCALFLWCVWPRINDAFTLVDMWNTRAKHKKEKFTYRTLAWEWIKLNKLWANKLTPKTIKEWGQGKTNILQKFFHIGMGYYFRANPEPCLLFVRGDMPVAIRNERNLLFASVSRHSEKPKEQYNKIERVYPGTDRLELFAREVHPGWTALGDEIDGADIRDSLPELVRVLEGGLV